ncbi:hypothetical protein SERLADRAFT_440710 [Serpula lacrymans var. lacrymans S7.9]|uniref:Uncharacterized protein n=1 Tax=Serpula lacrymans var. lacrymans (strain S7.9) TaxID=578457 RepID=F8P4B5_SERL9|nr:uncharacterized protein SERLADRAFT_440710 [Serpula lacrymans var. lacrymans S7.9]EGO21453.1 hypothetical protein SERLADRAFT_440710 [Serpula lacrymans var. lacrymans S7.9]
MSEAPSLWADDNVDKKCLTLLEKQMFEVPKQAGIASYYQWGLNAGEHQDNWGPYADLPSYLVHDDFDSKELYLEGAL